MEQSPLPTIPYANFETDPRGPRPKWVYAIVITYALLILGGTLAIIIPLAIDREGGLPILVAIMSAFFLGQTSLIFVPVRVNSRRPFTRRSLWFPLIGSGLLCGILILGAGIAVAEWQRLDEKWAWIMVAIAATSWLLWGIIFWMMSAKRTPAAIASRLHRYLLAGSVLELLVAVPTHLVVRRRTECCAGIATASAICAGVAIMILSFGPSVAFLYYRRWKQIRQG